MVTGLETYHPEIFNKIDDIMMLCKVIFHLIFIRCFLIQDSRDIKMAFGAHVYHLFVVDLDKHRFTIYISWPSTIW